MPTTSSRDSAARARASLRMRDWRGLRLELAKDRRALLQFFCAVTSYRPLPHMIPAHLAGPVKPEWVDGRQSSAKANKLMLGGIGAGKTGWAGAEFAMGVIANPSAWHLMAGPTHDQVDNVNLPHWLRYVEELEQAGYPLGVGKWHKQAKMQKLVCGGRVFARTYAKIGNLLGFEFQTVWTDEIETVPRSLEVWDTLDGRVRDSRGQWRQIIGTTTPSGLRNVVAKFHTARLQAHQMADPEERDAELSRWFWARHTGLENPHLPPGYLPGLRKHYSTRRWRQEVMAEILRPESVIWAEFEEGRHCIHFGSFHPQTMEYDLAYDAGDQYPHVLWIARDAMGRSIVFDELCDDNIPSGKLHEEIVARCERLKRPPSLIVCDRAVKPEIRWAQYQFPRSHVLRMQSRLEQSVAEGIEVVRDQLDPVDGAPRLLFAKHLVDNGTRRGIVACMSNYRYKTDMHGVITPIPHKDNVFDHGADALRMHQVAVHARHSQAYTLTRKHL